MKLNLESKVVGAVSKEAQLSDGGKEASGDLRRRSIELHILT